MKTAEKILSNTQSNSKVNFNLMSSSPAKLDIVSNDYTKSQKT